METGCWNNVLLTSAGWFRDVNGGVKEGIRQRFLNMLGKPAKEARVLFISTAAIDDEAKRMVEKCRNELCNAGICDKNIIKYDIDGKLNAIDAMGYDVVYFTGGNTGYLLRRIKETGFDGIIRSMVYANKVYVGVSAGTIIAAHDISTASLKDMATDLNALSLINAYISVHCPIGTKAGIDLPLPHIPLTDNQALAVSDVGYEIIEG